MVSSDTPSATPFLTVGSDKNLPKYSGKSKDNIDEFVYKLKPNLKYSSIWNCHLDPITTDENK